MQLFKAVFMVLLIGTSSLLYAQSKTHYTKQEMKRSPVWIEMIKSESVNYYDAEKAFQLYFSVHALPVSKEEEQGQKVETPAKENEPRKKNRGKKGTSLMQQQNEEAKMAFEVKKFKHWEMEVKPYVKDDGTIMNATERLKIWKESRP
jgi:hypothetical protein